MKLSMKPVYDFFAPADGFGEFVTILCIGMAFILQWTHRLTGDFAAVLTALNISGVAHDHLSVWLQQRQEKQDHGN